MLKPVRQQRKITPKRLSFRPSMRALQAKVETEAEAKKRDGNGAKITPKRKPSAVRGEVVSSRLPGSIGAGKRENRDNAPEGMHPG